MLRPIFGYSGRLIPLGLHLHEKIFIPNVMFIFGIPFLPCMLHKLSIMREILRDSRRPDVDATVYFVLLDCTVSTNRTRTSLAVVLSSEEECEFDITLLTIRMGGSDYTSSAMCTLSFHFNFIMKRHQSAVLKLTSD